MNKTLENLRIENAKVIFKNFSGEKTEYNREGNRNFSVVIDNREQAKALIEDGWNLKRFKPRDDQEDPDYYLPVQVSFNNYPPKVAMIINNNKVDLTEEDIGRLDREEVKNYDIAIRPYQWDVNGKQGIKAYLKTLYATIDDDDFDGKYAKYNSSRKQSKDIDDDLPF